MDDLISRKDLVETERLLMTDIVKNNEVARHILEQVLHDISHVPTAFNKEKVIEELKGQIELVSYNLITAGRYIKKDRAIKIVEKGGIE